MGEPRRTADVRCPEAQGMTASAPCDPLRSSTGRRAILRVVGPYVAFASMWILVSDRLVEAMVDDPTAFARLSIYKGWAFVLVTTTLLVFLMRAKLRDRLRAFAQLEDRVAERTRELAEAKHAAESADHLKSVFLATMSHELRTPLNSILGFTGIALQELPGPLNDEQRKQLGMVQGSARHLLALINDVLDISKIEAGQMRVAREPFDLRASIEKVAASMRPSAASKGLDLRVALSPEVDRCVGDRRRVEQILINLLSNAIKFTERGSVALEAAAVAGSVRLSVRDTGVGIKREDLEKLFQPFQQIDGEMTRDHGGTGLGLVICLRLARLLGGDVQVESEWGAGSAFTVTLPLEGEVTQ